MFVRGPFSWSCWRFLGTVNWHSWKKWGKCRQSRCRRWAQTPVIWWNYFTPYKWPYKWVNGVITLLLGVVTRVITGRGPPCRNPIEHVYIPTIAAFKSYGAHFYTVFYMSFFKWPQQTSPEFWVKNCVLRSCPRVKLKREKGRGGPVSKDASCSVAMHLMTFLIG